MWKTFYYKENISAFFEFHLKPLAQKVKSYIKDTNDFLKRGESYIVQFTPHLLHILCWKYFYECFMDKNLLHISLTKFNKLSTMTQY